MNTPAHLLVGTAVFAKQPGRALYFAALAGAMVPDLSLYVMVAVSIWGMGISPNVVFREHYYSDTWQSVFAVDNSFVLWGLLLGIAIWRGMPWLMAFAGAALVHIALDFPLHTHDARMHFWPITDWVFESPISYWDTGAHAGIVGPLEFALSLFAAVILWRRFRDIWIRIATAVFMVLEIVSTGIWQLFF